MSDIKLDINYKKIYDGIHHYIDISNYACMIIDTPTFQRLRYLRQLSACYYVFPCAIHTRFEHSIGTYYLAGRLINCIRKKTPRKNINTWMSKIPELQSYINHKLTMSDIDDVELLDEYVCELVKIAGLCHDLGHGPFSHLFDDIFLKNYDSIYSCHEKRSCMLVDYIYQTSNLGAYINIDELNFIKQLILPDANRSGFIYQIVSNSLNNIDVDKCDYIARDAYFVGLKYSFDYATIVDDVIVIDDIISYPEKYNYEIMCLFSIRYRLHRQIYTHKTVLAVQFMINDIIELLDPILNLKKSIAIPEQFINLTDTFIFDFLKYIKLSCVTLNNTDTNSKKAIDTALNIYNRIMTRDFYKLIGMISSKCDLNLTIKMMRDFDNEIDITNIVLYRNVIGYVSEHKNHPIDDIYFYNKNTQKNYTIKKSIITPLMSDSCYEYRYYIFIKNNDKSQYTRLSEIYNRLKESLEKLKI